MVQVKSNFEFDGEQSEELLSILENLTRDLNHIQDRQERLAEIGIRMSLQIKNGEPVVQLNDASNSN